MATIEQIEAVKKENRHELVLSGPQVSERIKGHGLNSMIYSLSSLNFLEISRTCLETLSEDLENLKGLTSLILHNNHLSEIPNAIGTLIRLKTLDLSSNKLVKIPDDVNNLVELQSFNVSCNSLTSFPYIGDLSQLHIFDISHNYLEKLPEGISNPELSLLAQITANNNLIDELPDDLHELPALKVLDVSNNKLSEIHPELSNAPKLKQFLFNENKLNDKRLLKMGNSCQTRSVLEYLRKSASKKTKKGKGGSKEKEMTRKERKKNKKASEEEKVLLDFMRILHFNDGITVQASDEVATVRPYLVCCIVLGIDFQKADNLYKRFITLQTKLHDSVCQSRQAGTIATHDLSKIKAPLTYEAKEPSGIMVTPLFKSKAVSAEQLVAKLRQEAEEFRKEKKRNTISGIHKYLDLLKDKPRYPCLVDKDGVVISFPPITNCDCTKISADTKDLLIEVTSTVSLDTCKNIMQTLLTEMLQLGLGSDTKADAEDSDSEEEGASATKIAPQALTLRQVQVLDPEGHMKVVYPSRVDLVSDAFKVIRDH